jgi:hypothetical protein
LFIGNGDYAAIAARLIDKNRAARDNPSQDGTQGE